MPPSFSRREVNRALLATAFALLTPAGRMAAAAADTPLFDFAIAGGWHHGLLAMRDRLALGERLVLRAEPDNPHDANAVAVHHADGRMLGYVPRAANEPLVRLLTQGACIEAEIVGRLGVGRDEDIPDDLVFTGFTDGDPRIRLTLRG
jgi:hypothetical protein